MTKAKLSCISAGDRLAKSNYQEFQRYQAVDLDIAADGGSDAPVAGGSSQAADGRSPEASFRGARRQDRRATHRYVGEARLDASYAWDASPVSVARLCSEIWAQVRKRIGVSPRQSGTFVSNWPLRLWDFDKPYRHIGGSGGAGMGYGAPAAVGAALANKKHGRLTVNIQTDGDLMYAPGVLWTAAHHRIPLLNVMHNNRAYHQELMEVQIAANQHNRGIDRAHIGTTHR